MSKVVLYCLPHAGAGAVAFHGWQSALGSAVRVEAVRLPGREARLAENDPTPDPLAIAARIAAEVDGPYAIFGHSMGALLGFEAVRELRRLGAPMPLRLFVSAARPPGTPLDVLYSPMPDEEFLAAIGDMGGMPPEVAAHEELRAVFLPILRADTAWLEAYRPADEPPLPVPIVALCGQDDTVAGPGLMAGWAAHSAVGYSQFLFPGGHFYVDGQLAEVAALIRTSLDNELMPRGDRVRLGSAGWTVWRDALLRTAGFPASGLERFAAPEAARAADALLAAKDGAREGFERAFAVAAAANSRAAYEVAVDPLVREAVTWQNPGALHALDGLAKGGPVQARNYKRRYREEAAARYWQRYCAKNETVGFFGPICWISLGDKTTIATGPALTRERMVFLEYWAVRVFAEVLERDDALRELLPPVLKPHLVLDGRTVRHPSRQPVELSAPQAQAVAWCDGLRPARDVVEKLELRRAEDGYLMLRRLVEQGVLNWGFDLPMRYTAEQELREKLEPLGEPAHEALSKLERLAGARREVQAAAGRPDELKAALARLDETFVELTGAAARRREGEAYAGRTLCHEETIRDLDVVLGVDVLEELAEPLGVLLQASRWLTSEMAEAYETALRELHGELGGGTVSLGQLYWLAQGLFFGTGQRPCDAVSKEFVARWERFFAEQPPVEEVFPADRPGWSLARIHSPDLLLCLGDGEFSAVLGEMHAAVPTFDTAIFLCGHDDPGRLKAELKADLGAGRVVLLYPTNWARTTGRVTRALDDDSDWELCFEDAPGARLGKQLPIGALDVSEVDGRLIARTENGESWPLLEVLAEHLSLQVVDAFKLVANAAHTPRMTLGRLVVARESWRTTAAATGLGSVIGDAERYLAVRRWRRELGLPEQVFVKIASETKPFYVNLTSPVYASMLCSAIRSTAGETTVVVTEMLPLPEQAWVPDAQGRKYFSELRIQIVDPERPR